MPSRDDRTPNRTLRGVRQALNLSQDEFAARLRTAGERLGEPNDATKRLVQRWESGASLSARPVYRRALELVTSRAYTQLGFPGADPNAAPTLVSPGETATAEPAEFASSSPEMVAISALRPEIGDRGRVNAQDVDELRARTARHRKLDDYLGGADTFRLYALDLEETASLIRSASYTAEVGRRLASLYAEQAQQAGWAAFDAGMHERAEQLYLASHEAARSAGDLALAGNAFALLGYQQNQIGQESVTTAAAAYRQAADVGPSGALVLFAQRLAWAHAVAGQVSAAQTALEIAAGHLREPDGRPIPDWAVWADEREQRIIEGRSWATLRRPLRAVPILESVLAEYEDFHARDKALYLMWLAGAYVDAGEVEAAAMTVGRALDLAEHVASARPARRAAAVLRQLHPHSGVPAVRELLERAAG